MGSTKRVRRPRRPSATTPADEAAVPATVPIVAEPESVATTVPTVAEPESVAAVEIAAEDAASATRPPPPRATRRVARAVQAPAPQPLLPDEPTVTQPLAEPADTAQPSPAAAARPVADRADRPPPVAARTAVPPTLTDEITTDEPAPAGVLAAAPITAAPTTIVDSADDGALAPALATVSEAAPLLVQASPLRPAHAQPEPVVWRRARRPLGSRLWEDLRDRPDLPIVVIIALLLIGGSLSTLNPLGQDAALLSSTLIAGLAVALVIGILIGIVPDRWWETGTSHLPALLLRRRFEEAARQKAERDHRRLSQFVRPWLEDRTGRSDG